MHFWHGLADHNGWCFSTQFHSVVSYFIEHFGICVHNSLVWPQCLCSCYLCEVWYQYYSHSKYFKCYFIIIIILLFRDSLYCMEIICSLKVWNDNKTLGEPFLRRWYFGSFPVSIYTFLSQLGNLVQLWARSQLRWQSDSDGSLQHLTTITEFTSRVRCYLELKLSVWCLLNSQGRELARHRLYIWSSILPIWCVLGSDLRSALM